MLRRGEIEVKSAGGHCLVCRKKIKPGPAVQVSKYSARIRHMECIPKKDTRARC